MSNNPIADERAYWHAQLGIVDDGSLSLADLRNKTAGAVHANRAAVAGDTAGLSYLTQAQGDARYSQLANAIPLSSSTPLVGQKNGVVGTEAAASHGDHVHPLGPIRPSFLYKTGTWLSPRRSQGNSQFNTLNRLYLVPYPLYTKDWRNITISALGVRCTTLQAASNARVGLYKSLANGEIDFSTVLAEVSIATTSTGDLFTNLGSNLVLAPDLYWMAAVQQGAVATLDAIDPVTNYPTVYHVDSLGMQTPHGIGIAGVTGALPTGAPALTTANEQAANVFIKVV